MPHVIFPSTASEAAPFIGATSGPVRDSDDRAVFEADGAGNVIVDLQTGGFLAMNDAFCALTGYSRTELAAMGADDLTHPDDLDRDARGWREALENGDSRYAIEKRYVRRDGTSVRVLVVTTLIFDSGSRPRHAAGTVFEMPARAVDTARERVSGAVVDASPVAVIALDENRRVEIWNPEAGRLFGVAAGEALGRRLLDLPLKWSSPDGLDALLDMPANEHATFEVETPGGRSIEVNMWCAPYSQDPAKPHGHVLLALDETEKKFLERALLDAGEREQRRIGQELHEGLCQKLMGATFVAQAMFREMQQAHSPGAERASSLARLLSDCVIEGRNLARGVNPVEIDSAGLMSALQEFSERLRARVHIELRCSRPVLVHSAEIALHVFRIAQEAVDIALRQGGATRILIRLAESDGVISLHVSDNGSGPRDAGIELGIMKYRAQAIRGELAVEFVPGSGATINCVFPNNR